MRRIIGFCGAAGAGKDEAASVLISEYGFTKRSFADALRREVSLALNDEAYRWGIWDKLPEACQDALLDCLVLGDTDPWLKPTRTDMRRLLQIWGTEFRRAQDPDYWVKRDSETLTTTGRFVYTDVRFPNEEAHILCSDGVLLRVARPGVVGNGHSSEQHYPQFRVLGTIQNDGTVAHLREHVRSLMRVLEDQ